VKGATSAAGTPMPAQVAAVVKFGASALGSRDGGGSLTVIGGMRRRRFATDSPLEGTGFEPSVPLLRPVLLRTSAPAPPNNGT
jgi:hypothetical protein